MRPNHGTNPLLSRSAAFIQNLASFLLLLVNKCDPLFKRILMGHLYTVPFLNSEERCNNAQVVDTCVIKILTVFGIYTMSSSKYRHIRPTNRNLSTSVACFTAIIHLC